MEILTYILLPTPCIVLLGERAAPLLKESDISVSAPIESYALNRKTHFGIFRKTIIDDDNLNQL